MFRYLFIALFPNQMTDAEVQKRYVDAGADFGDAVSYIFMGECIGFEKLLSKQERWETEYVRRGYRAISVDQFADYGGYGIHINGLGEKRADGEEPVLHARIYRQEFLGKIKPAIDLNKLMNGGGGAEPNVQVGRYTLPSTEGKN